MNRAKVQEMLIAHEGLKFKPYVCSAGKTSIGVGRNLTDKGISHAEVMLMLHNDIDEAERDLSGRIFQGKFYEFPEPVQHVLIDLRFNLGYSGFRKFKKMIQAVRDRDWPEMIVQMRESIWFKQVPNRAKNLIKMVESI